MCVLTYVKGAVGIRLACLQPVQQEHSDVSAIVAELISFPDILLSFPTATEPADFLPPSKPLTLSQTQSALFFLTKLKHNSLQRRKVSPRSGC